MDTFLCVVGLVLIIEGIPYFAFPEKMKALLLKLPLVPERALRMFGSVAIAAGLVLIYIARKMLS
jgi:uncharacterized protein YjeT (DUF2065 family)